MATNEFLVGSSSKKGKPQVKQVGEASETANEERQLKQQNSEPKDPDAEPQKKLSEFEKLMIEAIKEKEKTKLR